MFAVSSFILRFASAFLLYIVEILRDVSIPQLLFARDVARIYCELTSVPFETSLSTRRKIFLYFFSHSLKRYYDWKIIILLSMEFAIFLYILSRVKSCFLHFLDLSNVTFEGNDSSTCGTNAIDFDKIKESRI